MEQYTITGMSCAACSARVEKAVSAVEGVTACSVNLLTNSMNVEGTASREAILAAVTAAGYGASPKSGGKATAGKPGNTVRDTVRDTATSAQSAANAALHARLWTSVGLLLLLMYVSMGHIMWDFPLPPFIEGNPVAIGLIQMILAAAIMIINQKFFISGTKGLLHRAPNMDTLVALGSFSAFGYSVYALFAMSDAQMTGDTARAMSLLHGELYFEAAAMILTLITVGKMLEARAKGKTTSALEGLMKLAPRTATLLRDGAEITVPIDDVRAGDIFVVRPGEQIPVDGVVLEGQSAVNESALTGESIPADKEAGATVSSGTMNESGFLKCRATRVGEDTTLSQIIRMVSDASATKAPIAKIADRVSGVFVPTVLCLSLLTLIVWLIVGPTAGPTGDPTSGSTVGFAIARAISVLVISCPCALGLATPVAIMVGTGMGAKNGILFKTAAALEEAGKVKTIALDKTGTITEGNPTVVGIYPEGMTEEELLVLAAALEYHSEHPLAKAIRKRADENRPHSFDSLSAAMTDFTVLPGNGVTARINGSTLYGGSLTFTETITVIPAAMKEKAATLAEEGKTPLFFVQDGRPLGIIAVADVIKKDAREAIAALHSMGIRVVMLTGDNERTAHAIGREVGVDEVGGDEIIAGVLPDGKEAVIRRLQATGKVAMVGDGINDAPALTRADIGIAIGAGTDIAIDAADVVLVRSRLSDVPAAIRLSRATLRNIRENLFWAFIYNIIGIPLAAGVFYPLWGLKLNPMFGAAAMSLSSVCVVGNALRLNLARIRPRIKGTEPPPDTAKAPRDPHASVNNPSESNPSESNPSENSPSESNPQKNNPSENKQKEKENTTMTATKTMKIEGMMCGHCEAHVKAALEAIPGVAKATADHKTGIAVVTLTADVPDETLKAAVEAEDYPVQSIR